MFLLCFKPLRSGLQFYPPGPRVLWFSSDLYGHHPVTRSLGPVSLAIGSWVLQFSYQDKVEMMVPWPEMEMRKKAFIFQKTTTPRPSTECAFLCFKPRIPMFAAICTGMKRYQALWVLDRLEVIRGYSARSPLVKSWWHAFWCVFFILSNADEMFVWFYTQYLFSWEIHCSGLGLSTAIEITVSHVAPLWRFRLKPCAKNMPWKMLGADLRLGWFFRVDLPVGCSCDCWWSRPRGLSSFWRRLTLLSYNSHLAAIERDGNFPNSFQNAIHCLGMYTIPGTQMGPLVLSIKDLGFWGFLTPQKQRTIGSQPRQMANDTQYDVDDVYKESSPLVESAERWDDWTFMVEKPLFSGFFIR